jgi:hypothetical protein
MGSTQLLSVPYALFAKTADSLKSAAKINLSVSTSGDTLFVNGSYVIIPNISSANGVSLTTTSPTSITRTGANTGGNITNDGGFSITARGICYSTSPNPTLSNNVIQSGNGTGSFSVNISGLNYNTTYYVRAFATNSQGTFYGSQKSFITADLTFASLTTTIATSITANSCTTGGNISDDGGTTVTSRGVCYGTSFNPTIANSKVTSGSGSGIFSTILTGLTPNTMYYARAFATNTKGTAYGNQISFYTTSSGFSIGQNYDGGIIFYIDGTGQHGLIAAPNDQGTTQWGCSGTVISGANGTTIGSGQTNTTAIVTNCSTAGIAARICDDLVLGGKSDWFLPSEAELVMMYQNLPVQGLGGFTTGNYWSSSQSNDVTAVYVWFSQNGGYGGTIGKYVTNVNVRAIRKF